jgi:hypothetical protein
MQSLSHTLQPVAHLGIASATIWSEITSDVHIIGSHFFSKRNYDVNRITMSVHQGSTHRIVERIQRITHKCHPWRACVLQKMWVNDEHWHDIRMFSQCF